MFRIFRIHAQQVAATKTARTLVASSQTVES